MNDDLYRGVTDMADAAPGWVHTLAEYGTDGGVALLFGLLVVAWWRARRGEARAMALALLAPFATGVAYLCSELVKALVKEERPCRAVADAAPSVAPCPEVGDWSFPSNHATVAVASAVGVLVVWRAMAAFALPLAVVMAFSRVFVGVHYPLDVTAGAALGALLVLVSTALGARPVTVLVERLRQGALAPLLTARPPARHALSGGGAAGGPTGGNGSPTGSAGSQPTEPAS